MHADTNYTLSRIFNRLDEVLKELLRFKLHERVSDVAFKNERYLATLKA